MRIKKIFIFLFTFCFCLLMPLTSYAEEYGNTFPDYVNYSGGCYIEVQSSLGKGTIICQENYKNGYFGFIDNNFDVCNISNSTITGRYITSSGNTYTIRFSSFSTCQYQYSNGTVNQWKYLDITNIYNTNCEFIDYTDNYRDNLIDFFDGNRFYYTVVTLLSIIVLLLFFFMLKTRFE